MARRARAGFALALLVLLAPAALAEPPLEVRAVLVPRQEATLSSEMAGRIAALHVEEGQRFRRGDRPVSFGCEVQRAQLTKAAAEVWAAEKELEAKRRLEQLQSASQLEIDLAQARVRTTSAEHAVMQAMVRRCEIAAPFDGRVVRLEVNAFESVTAGEPLLSILDHRDLRVQLLVPSGWLAWLKTGAAFALALDETGGTHRARVTALGARIEPVSQSLEVHGTIDDAPDDLLAGMGGIARFAAGG